MPPGKNILMDESFKTLLDMFIPVISSLLTALVAWILRGKYEGKKRDLDLDKLAIDLRKEEISFREELMSQVRKLQEQVFLLEQTVHTQAGQINVLQIRLNEKDQVIQELQKDKAFDKAAILRKNEIIENLLKTNKDEKLDQIT